MAFCRFEYGKASQLRTIHPSIIKMVVQMHTPFLRSQVEVIDQPFVDIIYKKHPFVMAHLQGRSHPQVQPGKPP